MNGSKKIGGDEGSIGKLNMNRFNLNYMHKKKEYGGAHMVYGSSV